MTIRTILIRSAASAIPLLIIAGARGQSLNVDLDIFAGPPEAGNGTPGQTFGGAASQSGFWNRIAASGPSTPQPLWGLDGNQTAASIVATGGIGSYGGSGWQGNTGDYALLLNDYAVVADEIRYRFTGMQAGHYHIYTYAVNATGMQVNAEVWVPGSSTPNPQIVTGPMPGNAFALGITHSIHELTLTSDTFEIVLRGPWPYTMVNGYQIVAVPEPTALVYCAVGLALMGRRRRRKM